MSWWGLCFAMELIMLHFAADSPSSSVWGCNRCGLACSDVTGSADIQWAGGIIRFPATWCCLPHIIVISISSHQCNICYLTAVCSQLSTSCCLSSKILTLQQQQKLRARNEQMPASCSARSSASVTTSMYHHFASCDSLPSSWRFMPHHRLLCLADCWRLHIRFNCCSFLH